MIASGAIALCLCGAASRSARQRSKLSVKSRYRPRTFGHAEEPSLDGELSWRPGEVFTPETRKLAKLLGYR